MTLLSDGPHYRASHTFVLLEPGHLAGALHVSYTPRDGPQASRNPWQQRLPSLGRCLGPLLHPAEGSPLAQALHSHTAHAHWDTKHTGA